MHSLTITRFRYYFGGRGVSYQLRPVQYQREGIHLAAGDADRGKYGNKEITRYKGVHISRDEIITAFNVPAVKMPARYGIGRCSPWGAM